MKKILIFLFLVPYFSCYGYITNETLKTVDENVRKILIEKGNGTLNYSLYRSIIIAFDMYCSFSTLSKSDISEDASYLACVNTNLKIKNDEIFSPNFYSESLRSLQNFYMK